MYIFLYALIQGKGLFICSYITANSYHYKLFVFNVFQHLLQDFTY